MDGCQRVVPQEVCNIIIETNYNKELISIDDHGNGLEYAKKMLERAILKRQKA